ncbi:MAG: hypothetical protein ACKVWV_19610 [Planctomycetota bacterium]
MITDITTLDSALETLARRIAEDARLRVEFQSTRGRFAVDTGPPLYGSAGSASDRRHLEWFLLEPRPHEAFGRPAERLLRAENGIDADTTRTLLDSIVSVFEVDAVEPGVGYRLTDLVNPGTYGVADSERSKDSAVGDLYVGRIYPVAGSLHRPSRAAALFRDPALLRAVHADLTRAHERKPGALRITQDEIEKMFFATPSTDPVGEARRLLREAGLRELEIERVFESLARATPPSATVPFAQPDVLGEELDRIAFETDVDLDIARRALLAAWPQLARASHARPRATRKESDEIAEALAEFQRGEASGERLDKLLNDLETRLRIEAPDDPDALEPAPDFPGVVGAIVEEFLWEMNHTATRMPSNARTVLESFGRFSSHIGVFENLRPRDVLEFACRWLPEAGALPTEAAARDAIETLHAFCTWADQAQGATLAAPTHSALDRLRVNLPRVTSVNVRLSTADTDPIGQLYTCTEIVADTTCTLRDLVGALHSARLPACVAPNLCAGDRVRGELRADGELRVLRCYPPLGDEEPQAD